jgi:hypothetical protein
MGEQKPIRIFREGATHDCDGQDDCDHQADRYAGWSGEDLIMVQQLRQTLSDIERLQAQADAYPDGPAKDQVLAFYDQQRQQALESLRQVEESCSRAVG